MRKKFLLVKQPHKSRNKHTLAYALLFSVLLLGSVDATSFSLGYGFSDMRNVNNQTLLGLGVGPRPASIICANGISFAPSMTISGAILSSNYLDYYYNSSLVPTYAACFSNYTCALTQLDGTPYKTISNADPMSVFMNMSNVTSAMTYKAQCFVFDKVGTNASTEQRVITFNINIVIPPTPILNTTEYTNETMVILYGKATIPAFISSSGSSSTDLGNFVGFVLILIGIYGLIYYSRIFTEWH